MIEEDYESTITVANRPDFEKPPLCCLFGQLNLAIAMLIVYSSENYDVLGKCWNTFRGHDGRWMKLNVRTFANEKLSEILSESFPSPPLI